MRSHQGSPLPAGLELVSKSGRQVPVDGSVNPISPDQNPGKFNGQFSNQYRGAGVVLTLRDVTGHRTAQLKLEEAADKALEADRLKSKLLSTVSHELNNPLGAIKGFATFLMDNESKLESWGKKELLQEIDSASDRLANLIDHLLEFSRIESGNLPIFPELTRISTVVEGALTHFRIRAPSRKVFLDLPDDLPLAMVDDKRLRQVLDNLLDNSLKYTPPSAGIWILGEENRQAEPAAIRLAIRDDGPGIPAGQLERVFEPFKQSDGHQSNNGRGFGLGLAICRGIIEAHNGRIWAEQGGEPGTNIFIELPIEA